MPSDRSRRTDDPRYGYTGIVAQQGRVILDRDIDALQALTADRVEADALDFVGPCGTPDDGFRVSVPPTSPPGPRLWSPPAELQGSPPDSTGDFHISPGTMYVGGKRVTFPAEQNGNAVTYTYLDQPDWPAPPLPTREPFEVVYLELTELEVSAVEDPDLLEVALGGPDTTQRIKLLRRVHRMGVKAAGCSEAWAEVVAKWAQQGWDFDPQTMRLLPQARLKIGFTQDTSTGDPCDPVATGGYLGADNQLIRLRIAGSRLIWSYDNASFLYRVTSVSPDGTMLKLAADPPDAFHLPQTGQVVEILTTAAVFAIEPDETDRTGKARISRVAAEPGGTLRQLAQQYGPAIAGDPANYIVLDTPLPTAVARNPLPLFLRVWQAALPLTAGSQITIADPTTQFSTGVTATISHPAGRKLPDGAFWQVAVRPSTPQGVYPEDLLTSPQPPDGLRRWACPLAVIDWSKRSGPAVTDCRNAFEGLVALTKRKPGCCTISIGPSHITATNSLQAVLDRAAALASTVTVCLAPGIYTLPGSLYLSDLHSNLALESCGGRATLGAAPSSANARFGDGLVVIEGASGVTLRGLTLVPPLVRTARTFFADLLPGANITEAARTIGSPYTCFGVRVANSTGLTIEDCTILITNNNPDAALAADLFAAAIFLQADSGSLKIKDCTVMSDITPTYTRLAIPTAQISDVPPAALNKFNEQLLQLFSASTPMSALSSPPGVSPPDAKVLFQQRASNALEIIAAKRLALAAAPASGHVVLTVGVLAAENASLGNSVVCDCQFQGLTFAVWLSGLMSIVRLKDNTVVDGVAGLWVEVVAATSPKTWVPGSNYPNYDHLIKLFEEYQFLSAIAGALPLPALPGSGAPRAAAPPPPQPAFSLSITGNQVEIRQPAADAGASAAMRLALYREGIRQPQTSVIVSANRLRGGMSDTRAGAASQQPGQIPAAQITLGERTPCSITGNTIINGGAPPIPSENVVWPSLWVTLGGNVDAALDQLAATGNALDGPSDLALLPRPGPNANYHWSIFNADPN